MRASVNTAVDITDKVKDKNGKVKKKW
jgi:hypothetical protein